MAFVFKPEQKEPETRWDRYLSNLSIFKPRFDHNDPAYAPDPEKEKINESLRNEIKEIKKKKYNSKCADCSAKYPTYVVINFNIFICTNCSAHHRVLQHRIKSINLDDWTQSEVQLLRENGNRKSNKMYLALFNPDAFPRNCASSMQFINDKYIKKKWVKMGVAKTSKKKKKKKKKKSKKKKKNKDKNKETEINHNEDNIFGDFDPFNGNNNDQELDLFDPFGFGMNDDKKVNDIDNDWNPFASNDSLMDGNNGNYGSKSTYKKRKGSVVLQQSKTNDVNDLFGNNIDIDPFAIDTNNNNNVKSMNNNQTNNEWDFF